ncbi:efflux RND transporter permease subunit [Proteiniphilum sp.]|uniref:efflux RND transporter permease subunit n=1 Tax=Proteiniphilum sp. TaxID=1926877 RepID=UPI002B1F4F50|nr:efflux RND transporter permease subunit [Proteiniphilum sp.]MEA4918092.1 efflux RND transporter permease subunit [Proteiniphilum sp.]
MTENKYISSFTIIVAFVCLAIVGVSLIPLLPVKLSPSRTLPSITVRFNMPQNSARVVEMEATSRLESMLARIKGIRNMYSTSGNGWGSITLELDKHTSIDVARFEVSTIIRQTWPELPHEVTYPYISVNRPDEEAARPFMTYTINSAATPIVIQRYTENVIKAALSEIKGLYKIEVTGASPMEWHLEYDYLQLESTGVTVNNILQAISQYYSTNFLGMAENRIQGNAPSWIRITLASTAEEDLFDPAAILVANKDGALIRLDQLVRVNHTEREPMGYYRINGLNSIYLSLTAEESANQLRLNEQVKEKMKEVEALLPSGYEIHASYDATDRIHTELNKIYFRSGLTVLILTLFVLLITRNGRYLFLITTSLFVDLAIAVIFYYLFKLEIQLFSLAGITISLSLIIDNAIIMTDHIMHKGNHKAAMPILTATITTVGALSMIFMLDERIRLNLQDFAAVVMINLMVSLFVALLFVPALVERIGVRKRTRKKRKKKILPSLLHFSRERMIIRFTQIYGKIILLLSRRKWISFVCIVLIFGLPVFLIPEKIEKETPFALKYNEIVGHQTYKEKIKPIINKALGGTMRLFVEKVYQGSYFTRNEEIVLTITASMPNGTTLSQMNDMIVKMERYLSSFSEIRQFQTSIPNPRRASINVFFKKEAEHSGFPYQLRNDVVTKALQLGGGSWAVYGLPDHGFNNEVREFAGQYRVKLYGYNYDELWAWTDTLKQRLLTTSRRIKEVTVNSNFSWYKDDYQEFSFDLKKEQLAAQRIIPGELFSSLQPVFGRNMWAASVVMDGENENIILSGKQAKEYDIWALQNLGRHVGDRFYKLKEVADIAKSQSPMEVGKENQQYRLILQYDYIGSGTQGKKILERELANFNKKLPMGYTAESENVSWGWGKKDNKQYRLIGLLIIIIFFTTSILFNSLKQPLAVIFIIPVSFIGIFLTFYLFKLNFDQGGFASFILLAGITINAAIYILNEYNLIRKRKPGLSPLRTYLKAWNAKIVPIFLTVISTILGFIPFMVGTQKESFWFPLAAGTIGGLMMSFIGIFIFLPLMTVKREKHTAIEESNLQAEVIVDDSENNGM